MSPEGETHRLPSQLVAICLSDSCQMGRKHWTGDQTVNKRGFLGKSHWHQFFIWLFNVLEVFIWNILEFFLKADKIIPGWMCLVCKHEMLWASYRKHTELIYKCSCCSIQTSNFKQIKESITAGLCLPSRDKKHFASSRLPFPDKLSSPKLFSQESLTCWLSHKWQKGWDVECLPHSHLFSSHE